MQPEDFVLKVNVANGPNGYFNDEIAEFLLRFTLLNEIVLIW